jgi:hypothetical protein
VTTAGGFVLKQWTKSSVRRRQRNEHQSVKNPPTQLDYATPPPAQRPADRQLLFFLILPSGVLAALILGSLMFEDGDSRNFGGVMCAMVTAPVALFCGIWALLEATRPMGLRALVSALVWAILLAGGLCLALWIILHFRLLR